MNRCYSCFHEYGEEFDICPYCGTMKITKPNEPIHLLPGTMLAERYIVGQAVGSGGFGIIYKAWDTKLETIVAVKEFFVGRIMTRAMGERKVIVNKKATAEYEYRKERFLVEARNMAKFGNHRSIPNVFEFFEENGTAYIVMELLSGVSLSEYIKQQGGRLDQGFSVYVANEVGNALVTLHEAGIIHRDVAPDNIFICTDKEIRIKLLDLGSAKLEESSDTVIDIVLKPGYSPVEQYDNSKGIGPWTDVYALGATLYYMLTGIKPEESTNRKIKDELQSPKQIDPSIPENLSNAVMKAMAVEKHMRFHTVSEFLQAINGNKKVISLAKEKKLRKRKRLTGIIVAAALLVFLGSRVFGKMFSEKAAETLKPASISIWYAVADGSGETNALESIKEDFTSKYPDIEITLNAIPESVYENVIREAAQDGKLPTLFESTGLPDELLKDAISLDKVLSSKMASESMFLKNYNKYYSDNKRVPLGIEIPVAMVITSGPEAIEYSDNYFNTMEDFGKDTSVAADDRHQELLKQEFSVEGMRPREDFMNNDENSAAVMLSTTMEINDIRNMLTNYQKSFVYPKQEKIYCSFVYEWSIGNGSKDEVAAAEKLLSWMLGYSYQNLLMITEANDGQIPINTNAFFEKISKGYYQPINDIYGKFVFENKEE